MFVVKAHFTIYVRPLSQLYFDTSSKNQFFAHIFNYFQSFLLIFGQRVICDHSYMLRHKKLNYIAIWPDYAIKRHIKSSTTTVNGEGHVYMIYRTHNSKIFINVAYCPTNHGHVGIWPHTCYILRYHILVVVYVP